MVEVRSEDLVLVVQSPRDATYSSFLGDEANATFDPEKLTIVQRASGGSGALGLFLEVAIIGESHYVRLTRTADGKVLFTELLACVDPRQLNFEPSIFKRFSENEHFAIFKEDTTTGISARTEALIRPKTRDRRSYVPPSFINKSRELGFRLKQCFPGPLRPRTIVSVVLNDKHLDILTVHEYVTADHFIEPLTSETKVTFRP